MANYLIGENKCFREGYTKEELDDGRAVVKSALTVPWGGIEGKPTTFPPNEHTHSAYKVKGDFSTISTTVTIQIGDRFASTEVNLPSGFTIDNCTIISLMAVESVPNTTVVASYGFSTPTLSNYKFLPFTNGLYARFRKVSNRDPYIEVGFEREAGGSNVDTVIKTRVRIVLMKV